MSDMIRIVSMPPPSHRARSRGGTRPRGSRCRGRRRRSRVSARCSGSGRGNDSWSSSTLQLILCEYDDVARSARHLAVASRVVQPRQHEPARGDRDNDTLAKSAFLCRLAISVIRDLRERSCLLLQNQRSCLLLQNPKISGCGILHLSSMA